MQEFGKLAPDALPEEMMKVEKLKGGTWRESAKSANKKDKFSKEEVEQVLQALCRCAVARGITGEILQKLCEESQSLQGDKRTKFWTEVAASVPDRSVQAVHNFCRRAFNSNNNKGKWTEQDEQKLKQLVQIYGQSQWALVAPQLGRTQHNCRDKWKSLQSETAKGRWKLSEIINLIKLIEKAGNVELFKYPFAYKTEEALKEIKNEELTFFQGYALDQHICYFWSQEVDISDFLPKVLKSDASEIAPEHDLPWRLIAKKIKSRNPDSCRIKWAQNLLPLIQRSHRFKLSDDLQLVKQVQELKKLKFKNIINGKSEEQNRERWKFLKQKYEPKGDSFTEKAQQIASKVHQEMHIEAHALAVNSVVARGCIDIGAYFENWRKQA